MLNEFDDSFYDDDIDDLEFEDDDIEDFYDDCFDDDDGAGWGTNEDYCHYGEDY